MNKLLNEIILPLVNRGIEVTVKKYQQADDEEEFIVFDMNTDMKSHCYVYEKDGKFYADTRYEKNIEFEIIYDLIIIVKGCLCGRDYMNPYWADLLKEEGYIKVITETRTKIEVI